MSKIAHKPGIIETVWDWACALWPFLVTGIVVFLAMIGVVLLREDFKKTATGSALARCEAFCAPSKMKNMSVYGEQTSCECEPRAGCGIEYKPSTLLAPMLGPNSVICVGSNPARCLTVKEMFK
jgi:hypothetical protein